MRLVLVVIGVLVALAGTVWALQGVGVLLGSFMSNNPTWVAIGSVTAIVGLGLIVLGLRSGPAAKKA